MVESNLFLLAKWTLTPFWSGRLWGWVQKGKFIQDIRPVSYTHLDVYKRQRYGYTNCVFYQKLN